MPDDDRRDPNDPQTGALTPEDVAYRSFSAERRGISESEVRHFLQEVAQEMADAVGRERELLARVHDLEERLAHPRVPTEEDLLDHLGEETTRVLRSAQEAADEIKANATTRAQAIIEQAEAEATRIRAAAESVLTDKTREAEVAATVVQREAEGKAQAELRQAARDAQTELDTARQRGRDMVGEARAVRERILGDLGKRRAAMQAELEQLRVARDELLGAGMVAKSSLSSIVDALAAFDKATAGGPDTEAVVEAEGPEAEVSAEPEAEPAAPEAEEPAPEAEEAAPEPEAPGPEGVAESEPETELEPEPEPDAPSELEAEPEPEPETELEAEPEPDAAQELEPEAAGSAPRPPVDDLFARIRATRVEKVDQARAVLGASAAEGAVEAEADAEAATDGAIEEVAEVPEGATEAAPKPEAEDAEAGEAEDAEPEGGEPEGDERLLAERDAALAPIHHDLLRACKRALQDEQNELLDRLRRQRRIDVEQLLQPLSVQVTDWADVLEPAVDEAYGAGRRSLGGSGASGPGAPRRLVSGLAESLVTPLRERLLATFDAVPGDGADRGSELASRVGARYREWRSQEMEIRVGDLLAAAYTRGVYEAAPEGARLRWVSAATNRCADCDDNALEPTPRGAKFPTGQQHPPAHPGCHCLLAVVDEA